MCVFWGKTTSRWGTRGKAVKSMLAPPKLGPVPPKPGFALPKPGRLVSLPMFPLFLQLPEKWTIYKHESGKNKKCLSVAN